MIGFIGLGVMGEPMALNLVSAGTRLLVWNRSAGKCEQLRAEGARVASTAAEVFASVRTTILMLADEEALDTVLQRGTPEFESNVEGRTIIHMGTTSPVHSRALADEVLAAGGRYVEAPVSGSRLPAEEGGLVIMLAGEPDTVEAVAPILAPMGRKVVRCGPVPNALLTKLAINHFMVAMVAGLAEAAHFASRAGVDMEQFRAVLDAGSMASGLSREKLAKLIDRDFTVQAPVADALRNARLISEAARAAGIESPLLDVCQELYDAACAIGHGREDVSAVLHAFEERSGSVPTGFPDG